MSTLRVDRLENTSSIYPSTPHGMKAGVARAWGHINGRGSVSFRGSHNMTSVTDLGTGRYQFDFNFTITNGYSVVASSQHNTTGRPNSDDFDDMAMIGNRSAERCYIHGADLDQGLNRDPEAISVAIFSNSIQEPG